MKTALNRSISMLLVIVMCVGMLSGLVINTSATVNYKTGDADGFEDVILNWGQRGTTATFLSPNAEAFYEDNNTSYDQLSALSGSSDTDKVMSSALYRELSELMSSNHATITSYSDTRDLYRFTDCQNSDNSSISSFYSGVSIGPKWDGGATWNREHTWPNSKGMDGSDEDDIMMLRPTSKSENSQRGNKAYGESVSEGFYDPNELSNGQLDNHGDVARTMLYIYVRWGNPNLFGLDGAIENLDVLLKWIEEDPVDTWELGRNDSVESITGTRNVFVDYPELAFLLFDEQIPADMDTPSGEAQKGGNSYTVTATVNNSAFGTVTVNGKNINAFPTDGYEVVGYTLLSGSAEVIRNGNVFVVNATSDCEIRVNFEARGAQVVTFTQDGVTVSTVDAYYHDSIVIPGHTGNAAEGYDFIGWVTAPVSDTTAAPSGIYYAGSSYTVTDDVTFYALYSRLDNSGSGQSSIYEAYTGKPVEGDYLIVSTNDSNSCALKVSITKNRFDMTQVSVISNSVMNPDADIIWHIAPTGDGYFTVYNKNGMVYAGGSGVKSQGKLLGEVTEFAKWDISADLVFENVGNRSKLPNNCTLRRNADFGFACYNASTGTGITLYKMVTGTVYYSTETGNACQHTNTENVPAQDPSCTTAGFTAGVICVDCQTYLSGHEEIPAPGHNYEGIVTEPTVTEGGFTTYTCSVCGDSYVSDYTEALGELFKVSFSVPAGVDAIADVNCGKAGIQLPTAGVPSGEYEYVFLGWAEERIDHSETKPVVYLPGSTFKAKAEVTLYAVYSYAPGGMGTGAWELVTDASQLFAGAEVVLASNVKGAVPGVISNMFLTTVGAVFSDDLTVIESMGEGAVTFTLGGTAGQWTLSNNSGNLLGSTAVKKLGWDKGTTTWTISFDEAGNVILQNTAEECGRFLYNVNNPRFTTYTTDTNVSMLLPQLYKRDGAIGTVYYTTEIDSGDVETGVSVSGSVGSFGDDADEITVELLMDGEVAYSVTVSGSSYSLENVIAGNYILRLTKANHVTQELAVTVGSDAVVVDVQICLIGDVNNDGKVNMKDWAMLYSYISEITLIDGYMRSCADVNGDGKVNMKDWSRLYNHISEIDPLW